MRVMFGLLLTTLLPLTTAFEWTGSLTNKTALTSCSNSDLDLPWNFILSPDEKIEDVKWFFVAADGEKEQLIAVYINGYFNPSTSFSDRVNRTGLAGIVLSKPSSTDSGNYSIEVTIEKANMLKRYSRSTNVSLIDPPRTESGKLQVRQELEPVYNKTTGEWTVQLSCGDFTELGQPPIHVVWTVSDSNSTLESSSEDNGTFRLLLPNPLSGGNYTCALPPNTNCLQTNSPLLEGTTVTVDEVKASYTLLEARQRETETKQNQMMDENADLRAKLGNYCTCSSEKRVSGTRRVSFHATLATDFTSMGTLKPFTVITNEGQAFNGTSGEFTAPVNGSYFFAASVGTDGHEKLIELSLLANEKDVSHAFAQQNSVYQTMGSVQATLSLTTGSRVRLHTDSENASFSSRSSSFTGFLISADD